jgi:NDP-sugar pyrophosphorylase family protein
MNSDLLTNLDYEHFYIDFIKQDADFAVVTIPYQVNVPYAVLETTNGEIKSFKEKPIYTYYSNGGIYLMKKSVLNFLPKEAIFNATDLMEKLIEENKKVVSYPLLGYWLDIGKHEDFEKAQIDIKQIRF